RGLAAAYAGSPGVVVGERPLQRLHLAQGTAGVGVALEESRTVLAVLLTDRLARLDREHPDRHALGDLVTYPKRLREVQPGVEEHHVDAGCHPGGQVGEDTVGHGAGDAEARTELLHRPFDDRLGRRAVQFGLSGVRDLGELAGRGDEVYRTAQ